LVGGCLRVLDTEYVPVHRHTKSGKETRNLKLAVVTDVDEAGQALGVRLCDETIQFPIESLPGSPDTPARTGDQLACERADNAPDGAPPESITRIRGMGPAGEDETCWVLLVTDTSARPVPQPESGGKPRSPVRYYAGRIGPGSTHCEIPEHIWENYKNTVKGADDLRTAQLTAVNAPGGNEPPWGTRPPEYADVFWPPQKNPQGGQRHQIIGQRLRARTYLHKGQPVWVRVTEGEVTEIRLSQLWRYRGTGPVGKRVGDARPCTEPEELCWSCRIFGSADTEGRDEDDTAFQHNYRGHVRIDDFLARGNVIPIEWHLAPLASPRPGAGQFYLDNSTVPAGRRIAEQGTKPAMTWGSIADELGRGKPPRAIRGRKLYWRTETDANPASTQSRGRKREHQSEKLTSEVTLIPAGTVFDGRVTFDNLDATDYGSLLAALDPRLLAWAPTGGWADTVISVGGGKPFGFGSVTIDVKRARTETAAQRYLGETAAGVPDSAAAVQAFRARAPYEARMTWRALGNLLTFGFIDDAMVWYPPGTGQPGDEDYDESFKFFARTTGVRFADGYRDLVVLPDPGLPSAFQILDSEAGEHLQGPG
jgi:hypothetical protein